MKILVLVLATRLAPYPALIRTIKRTWAACPVPDAKTLFYYGGAGLELDGDDLTVPAPGGRADIGRASVACFEYVLRHREFDVVFRTNCSSYVDLRNLCDYARAHVTGRFYSGLIGLREIPFASGSGYFLSRDLVELVVRQQSLWNHDLVDDRALAALLARNHVAPVPAPRQDFRWAPALGDIDTSLYHFRCRTTTWRRFEDRRIMLRIHRAFCAERGLPLPRESLALGALAGVVRGARGARRVAATIRRTLRPHR